MKVLIDGDGCPVIAETERAAALYGLEVLIFCDTSHLISSRTSRVILVDQGRDAAGKARRSSRNHLKGPPKRDKRQNELFFQRLCAFLEKIQDK